MLVQDILKWTRLLRDLVEVFGHLSRFVVLAAESTNMHEIFSVVIGFPGPRDDEIKFHWRHFVQVWDLTSGVDFHQKNLFSDSDAISASFWDISFQLGSVHTSWDGGHTHHWVRLNGAHVNVASQAPCARSAICKNKLFTIIDVHAGAENIFKHARSVFQAEEFVLVSNTSVCTIHHLRMDCDVVEPVVTLQHH